MEKNLDLKHHKDFHRVQFQGLTTSQRNLVFALCYKVMNQEDNLLVFDISEISTLSNLKKKRMSTKGMFEHLENLYNILKNVTIKLRKENGVKIFSLFTDFETFEDEGKFQIKVHSSFRYMINNIRQPFTIQSLKEYTSLKSGYSQLLYSLLKEWEKKKELIFTIDEFRNDLGIPETYDFNTIDKRVISPILKELPQYFPELKIEKIKTGKKVTSLKFTWNRELEKIESYEDDVVDIIEISEALNKTIEKTKKNRFIAPLLTVDNIEILVEMFEEKDLIKGLNWSYNEINQEIKSLNYLIKSIKIGMKQKEKKIVIKTDSGIVLKDENIQYIAEEQKSETLEIKTRKEVESEYFEYLEKGGLKPTWNHSHAIFRAFLKSKKYKINE
jgi:plasmid replication initiation protein